MKNIRLKRELAEIGKGDPLNRLVHTQGELRKMGFKIPIKKRVVHRKRGKREVGNYTIETGGTWINKRFESRRHAINWGIWNYRGPSGWRVVRILKKPPKKKTKSS